MHPLVSNLKNLTTTELQEKYKDLNSKLLKTNNASLQHQIFLLLEDYYIEIENRNKEEIKTSNIELDNLIKVQ